METTPWRSPRAYRVERTREGRHYELLAETQMLSCYIKDPPRKDPWFYRVTAVNARGEGEARKVYFFQRFGNGKSRLLPIAVRPGLRVVINELLPT